ncbi:MAG: hypothetical protein R2828_11005 [Saprospiraceae bacterium]
MDPSYPKVLDTRLSIELIAVDPAIVTPIGLAIDEKDALYILESHTHTQPSDYAGPRFDRIKKGIDEDGDGKPESWLIFADSITDGMNLAFGPDGWLFLVEKDEVLAFRDNNGDGISDERKSLLVMSPPDNVYDHAGLLGITYSPDGWLYISRGNTGGQHWRIKGTDGLTIEGYGDGGNVIRCRADGSQVAEVATGFWNPFDLKFTRDGRLMLLDNDPDSRGPNRLIEIVPGGNYGYQSLYGGSGIHPFLAWNGELPGTLPYAAAIGEAPTGLIDAEFSNFPEEYASNVLAMVWEENNIVRIPLQPWQSSVQGDPMVIVQGDSTFHPVAMAANSRGDLYLTDWVLRQYPNHGKGKIWRLRAHNQQPLKTSIEGNELARGQAIEGIEQLVLLLQGEDPFLQAIARHRLKDPVYESELLALLEHSSAQLRLQGLLTLSAAAVVIPAPILQQLLADKDMDIRRMTLIYIAQQSREELLIPLQRALSQGAIPPELFETYLATLKHLQPEFIAGFKSKKETNSRKLPRALPENYLLGIVKDELLLDEIRAAALPYLTNPEAHLSLLLTMLKKASLPLKEALFQLLRGVNDQAVAQALLEIVLNQEEMLAVRIQALVALGDQAPAYCEEIAGLLQENEATLQAVALRYLSRCQAHEKVRATIKTVPTNLQLLWQQITQPTSARERPQTVEEWATFVNEAGNIAIGRTIFQSSWAICQTCHRVNGWGGTFGPDLSHIGSSKSKEQLIMAIIEPSKEISPEWQGWFVTTKEGEKHYGRQIDVGLHDVELMLADGEFVTFKTPKNYGVATQSLMPEGLQANFSTEEFNHLVNYLISLK